MSTATVRGRAAAFLPAGMALALTTGALRLSGLALIGVGFLVALALVTHDPMDPSANVANQAPATGNWLGPGGAAFADWVVQLCGVAAIWLAALPLVWGLRLFRHGSVGHLPLRLFAAALVLAATAAAFGGIPDLFGLTGPSGLGGAVGAILLPWLESIMQSALDIDRQSDLARLTAAILALPASLLALGLRPGDWLALAGNVGSGAQELSRHARQAGLGTARGFSRTRAHWRARAEPRPSLRFEPLEGGLFARVVSGEGPGRKRPPAAAAEAVTPVPPAPQRPADPVPAPARSSPVRMPGAAPEQPALDLQPPVEVNGFPLPAMALLTPAPAGDPAGGAFDGATLTTSLSQVLSDFGIRGEILGHNTGPVVTLFELEPAPGTKSSRVIGLADDIARSMSALSVRVAVIPGRNAIGIELPNPVRQTVYLRDILESPAYRGGHHALPLALGKDIGDQPVIVDLAKMPHLLVAGTTGSGKSVGINAMLLSLLYRLPPEQCRLIMIDPKMLELSVYEGIPHLLCPVVTDPGQAVVALKWAVREMEDRYRAMANLGVRSITAFNQRLEEARERGESLSRRVQTGFDADTGKPVFEELAMDMTRLPYIVVVVDEMADLMLVAGKDIEAAIQRLAQMARAAGIHLIMATQRPSVDVITGTIKANFPTRISFQVTSKIDSRTILGEAGAEQLLGQGDMLHMAGGGRITRVHGPFVSDGEVEKVVAHLRGQADPAYDHSVLDAPPEDDPVGLAPGGDSGDALFDRAVDLVARERKASTSFVQRHLQIGYNRAARLIERMETEGMIGKPNHVGKREVLLPEP